MNPQDWLALAKAERETLVAVRRDLHMHPELAFKETRTAGIVAETLRGLGLDVKTGVGKTGVIGLLEGTSDGQTVFVRADMDALPVKEANDVPYASTVQGKMHACGHDSHVAMALTVAKLFSERRDQIKGRIKFAFQPAEEVGSGAEAMIEDGALEDPAPDVALGMHVWNTAPVGTLGIASGPIMAGSTGFRLNVTGRGGHGAMPQDTIDPVIASAHIITALQSVISRNVSALDTAVLSVCSINGGDAHNIIPSEVTLRGTLRYYDDDIRKMIVRRVQTLSENIAAGFGCKTTMKFYASTPPVINDPDVTGVVLSVGAGVVGEDGIMEERVMGSEDMACYLDRVPGCFFFVGSAPEKDAHAHHHPNFDINEDALPIGAATMCAAIAYYVMES